MSIQVYQTSRNRSIYVFGWCLWQEYLSFYILTPTKLLYKLQRMSWIYGGFDIVTIIFCHALCMLYHVWLCSCQPCNLSLLISFFITNNPMRKKTLVKWSIITLSRVSKVIWHLASHPFVINQVYQIRRKIWQYINYNFTESIKSKLGDIWFSVVWFHLSHFIVQVTTWWWFKSWHVSIGTKGGFIGFSYIVVLVRSNSKLICCLNNTSVCFKQYLAISESGSYFIGGQYW